jgi:bifunctional DNA-binding transcriptional regulator/antitoxin component of YhaV-PrlF toxin-antitoxin module
MASRVGAKGNIVIDKQIRDRLGVQPGWEAIQLLRDGFVEIHFLPPVEAGATAGRLPPRQNAHLLATSEGIREVRAEAFRLALSEKHPDLVGADDE